MADETVIIDIQYDTKDAVKAVENLSVSIDANKKKQAELKDQLKKNEISQADYAVKMAETTQTINRQTFERKKYLNVLQAEAGSVKRAKAENQILREERNKLSTSTKKGRLQIEEYNKKIDANSKALIGNVDQQSKMFSSMGQMPGVMGKAQSGIQGINKAFKLMLANPIVLFVTAIVGAFMAMKAALTGSEEGQNKLNKVTMVFKTIMGNLGDIVRKVGMWLIDAVTKPKEAIKELGEFMQNQLINRFLAFGKIGQAIVKIFSKEWKEGFKDLANASLQLATGIEDVIGKVQEFGKEIEKENKIAIDLANRRNALDLLERENLVKTAKLRSQIAEARVKAVDKENFSAAERIKFLKEAIEAENEILRVSEKIAIEKFKLKKEQNALSDSTKEDLNEQAQLEAEMFNVQTANSMKRKELTSQLTRAQKEYNKEIENQAKESEKANEKDAKEQAEILARRQDAILKLQEIENQRLLSLEEDLTARRDLMIEFEEEEFERLINNELLLNEEKELLRAEHTQNLDEIEAKYREDKVKAEQEVLNATIKNIEDVTAAAGVMLDDRIKMRGEFLSAVVSLNKLEAASEKEKYDIVTGLFSTLTGFITAGQQEEFNQLEQQKAAELELAGNNSEAREGIERKYSKAASDLKRKQFNEDKTKAILDIALNTAVAVVKSLPNIPLSIIVGGIGLASGIAVGTKKFTPETYEQGGKLALFGGNSHANGGTHLYGTDGSHLEVEKGEAAFVLNKEASSEIAALSVINESFGGRAMSGTGRYLEDGGQASQGINPQDLASAMQNVKIVTEITDIKTGMSKYDKVIKNSVV